MKSKMKAEQQAINELAELVNSLRDKNKLLKMRLLNALIVVDEIKEEIKSWRDDQKEIINEVLIKIENKLKRDENA